MAEAGYSWETCLAYDRSCLTFVQRYRRMRDKTKMEPVPLEERVKARKRKAMREVPAHTNEELLKVLGVNPEDDAELLGQVLGELDAAMWDSTEWEDDDEEEED